MRFGIKPQEASEWLDSRSRKVLTLETGVTPEVSGIRISPPPAGATAASAAFAGEGDFIWPLDAMMIYGPASEWEDEAEREGSGVEEVASRFIEHEVAHGWQAVL